MTIIGSSSADITALKAEMADKADTSQLGYALVSVGTVTTASRTVVTNPFGINTPVITWTEVQLNNKWYYMGFSATTGGGFGTSGGYVEGEGLVVRTGGVSMSNYASYSGGLTNDSTNNLQSAPVRIHVWKVTN